MNAEMSTPSDGASPPLTLTARASVTTGSPVAGLPVVHAVLQRLEQPRR